MKTLLIAEQANGTVSEPSRAALTAAQALGAPIDVLLVGAGLDGAADAAAKLVGVKKVLVAEDERLDHGLPEAVADIVLSLKGSYDIFVTPATSNGKNFMPRIAARLDVMQISEVIEIISPNIFKRPIYAGNAVQVVQSHEPKIVMTVRAASFSKAEPGDTSAPIQTIPLPELSQLSTFEGAKLTAGERPDLASARVVVSGGRALGSAENFQSLLFPLADKLQAAIGASRAAVDAGFAPNDWQVGQTGKIVAPELYIACGISGAIQHLAGMKDSKVVVAINKDPDAPIFQMADYGLVADLFDALPELTKRV